MKSIMRQMAMLLWKWSYPQEYYTYCFEMMERVERELNLQYVREGHFEPYRGDAK